MNAFDAFASQHARKPKPAPRERLEKQQAEDNALMKRYRRLIREERERCYAMPGGADALEVVRWARKMTLEDGDTLVIKVRRLRPERMAKELRFRLLSDLDDAIMRLRVRSGMAEFDDPFPWEADNVFRMLKGMLG